MFAPFWPGNYRNLHSVSSVRDWLWSAFVYTTMVDYPTEANFMRPLPAYPVQEVRLRFMELALVQILNFSLWKFKDISKVLPFTIAFDWWRCVRSSTHLHRKLASLTRFSLLQACITITHMERNALTWKMDPICTVLVVGIGRYV